LTISRVPAQQRHYVQTLNHSFINITERDRYELGVPLENKEYELAKLHPGANGLFDFIALKTELDAALAAPIEFHEVFLPAAANAQARLIKWDRSYYWNDNRTNILPRGNVGQTTLLHHKENACFSKTLIGDVFGSWVDNNTVQADGHYELKNNYWWQKDNIQHYNTAREFNLLNREERPDGGLIHYTYDAPYFLTLTQVRDALGNRTQAVIDYHVIAPHRITDLNDNQSDAMYDPLGVVVVSTIHGDILGSGGAPSPYGNDRIDTYNEQADASFATILSEPTRFLQNVSQYHFYELDTWAKSNTPPRSLDLVREEFVHDGRGGGAVNSPIQVTVIYSDGFGRELQTRQKVENGPAIKRDSTGAVVLDPQGRPEEEDSEERWLASGHTVYNNKQLTVRQYEPFYSTTADFESDAELQAYGVSTHTHYDAVGREQRVDMPNGTFTKVETTPWKYATMIRTIP